MLTLFPYLTLHFKDYIHNWNRPKSCKTKSQTWLPSLCENIEYLYWPEKSGSNKKKQT